jgi:UDP-N-acetylmuramyl pentapeptide synthase
VGDRGELGTDEVGFDIRLLEYTLERGTNVLCIYAKRYVVLKIGNVLLDPGRFH